MAKWMHLVLGVNLLVILCYGDEPVNVLAALQNAPVAGPQDSPQSQSELNNHQQSLHDVNNLSLNVKSSDKDSLPDTQGTRDNSEYKTVDGVQNKDVSKSGLGMLNVLHDFASSSKDIPLPPSQTELSNNSLDQSPARGKGDIWGGKNVLASLSGQQDSVLDRSGSHGKGIGKTLQPEENIFYKTENGAQKEEMSKGDLGSLSSLTSSSANPANQFEHAMNNSMMGNELSNAHDQVSPEVNLENGRSMPGMPRDDEPTNEGDPDSVEIKLSTVSTDPFQQEHSDKLSNVLKSFAVNRDSYHDNDKDLSDYGEDDRPRGNPTFMSDSDMLPQDQNNDASGPQQGNSSLLNVIQTIVDNDELPDGIRNQDKEGNTDIDHDVDSGHGSRNVLNDKDDNKDIYKDDDNDDTYKDYDNVEGKDDDNDDGKEEEDEVDDYSYSYEDDGDDGGDDFHREDVYFKSSPLPSSHLPAARDDNEDSSDMQTVQRGDGEGEKAIDVVVTMSSTSTHKVDDYHFDEDSDWYYNTNDPQNKDLQTAKKPEDAAQDNGNGKQQDSYSQIAAPDFKEGVISVEDVLAKKTLQAPKKTIVLYTILIVIFITGIVLFSIWKNPFKRAGRPLHSTGHVRNIEEGKRLLDHPFV